MNGLTFGHNLATKTMEQLKEGDIVRVADHSGFYGGGHHIFIINTLGRIKNEV